MEKEKNVVTQAITNRGIKLSADAKGALLTGGSTIGLDVLVGHSDPRVMAVGLGALWLFGRHTTHMLGWKEALSNKFLVRSTGGGNSGEVSSPKHSIASRLFGGHMKDDDSKEEKRQLNQEVKSSVLDRLVGKDMVELADDLQIHINDLAGKSILCVGIRRSGKTTLGVNIAEKMGKFNIPMFIPDLKGDWLSCVDTLPNAVILGREQITVENAKMNGYAICEHKAQVILDITSYDDMNDVAIIIAQVIEGIFLWERKHPDNRQLCAVFLDEAQSFLPQDLNNSIIPDSKARDAMLNAYMRAAAVGGSLGLFPVVLSQRIAQTNNKIIGQPELLFLMRQTMDNDFNRYKNFTKVPTDEIRALKQGQGIFVDIEGRSSIHMFHKRLSNDSMSRTPRVNTDIEASPATKVLDEPCEEEDYYEEEEPYLENDYYGYDETEQDPLPQRPIPIIPEKGRLAEDVPPEAAIAVYNAGNTSRYQLARVFGLSENQGRKLKEMIESQAGG